MTRIILPLLCLWVVCVAADQANNEVTDLEIITLHKPDDCKKFSKRGDMLSMHYQGTLKEGGKEFDSR